MKIAVAGISGRMGLTLARVIAAAPCCTLARGSERSGFDEKVLRAQLAAAGAPELAVVDSPAALIAGADAVIDFTVPEASVALAKEAAKNGIVHIIGTTGFTPAQQKEIAEAANKARIVQSGNFSVGVTVFASLIERAAELLDEEYDVEVDEMHHARKVDAPSGTALLLADAAARGRGVALSAAKTHYGEGHLGERKKGTIGMSVRRGGDVVGVHTVTFAGPGENLELTHRGFARDIYARGALKAAQWAKDKPAGLYTMRDVVGL